MIRDKSGFTMIELFMIMALMSILAAIAIPNIGVWMPNYKLKSAMQEVYSDFQRAKITAIKRGVNCTITFLQSIDGKAYDYVVYVDSDNDLVYDDGEEIISKVNWKDDYDNAVQADDIAFTGSNDDDLESIAFIPNGLTKSNSGAMSGGHVQLKNTNGRTSRLVVSLVGNIRLE